MHRSRPADTGSDRPLGGTDLLEGCAFYERQRAGVGDYFPDSLFADIDGLTLFAGIYPKPDGRLYRTPAKRFPFAIYYDVQEDIAMVVAVLDCCKNPASLTERLERGWSPSRRRRLSGNRGLSPIIRGCRPGAPWTPSMNPLSRYSC